MLEVSLPQGGHRLLLHSCCAPCSGAIIECLMANGIRPAVFFSNSNIVPWDEYELRREEIRRYTESFGLDFIDDDYDHEAWLQEVQGHENDPERGTRCSLCFRFRLLRAARYAAENGYDVLTTTLASSRWKDVAQVDAAGRLACAAVEGGPLWWGREWRKGGLQLRRSEIIREQDFYNQTFCGCEFSRKKAELL